jgi:hypothetical protein
MADDSSLLAGEPHMKNARSSINRFSLRDPNPPLRRWSWKINDQLGTAELVPEEWGWPPKGELITTEMASLAITHRRGDIVARYLRETEAPAPHVILRIAELFDRSKGGVEADRLSFEKRRNNHPLFLVRAHRSGLQIGHEIARIIGSGATCKHALSVVTAKFNIGRSTALSAYGLYRRTKTSR